MTWIHAVKRQGVIAVLSIGLAIPAVGLAGAALADSQGHGAASANAASHGAASNGHNADNNGNANGKDNGNGESADVAGSTSSASASQADGNGNGNSAASDASNGNGNNATVDSPAGCPNSFHLNGNGNGANVSGAYDSTCDGSASGNGNGNGNAGGKPCAGCVGNADDKNPPGQEPDGSDHNNGYECDGNHGVGKTNPAHSGCTPTTTVDKCPDGSAMPTTDRNGDGKVNAADCDTGHVDCPPTASAAAEHANKGNGNGNAKGNNGNGNGKGNKGNNGNGDNANGNNGQANGKDKDCSHKDFCPDGSVMSDRNGDGKVNTDDCGDVDHFEIVVLNHGNPPEVLGEELTAPAAAKPASLPFTGTNAVNMALIADLILLAGTLAIWASGYRRQAPDAQR